MDDRVLYPVRMHSTDGVIMLSLLFYGLIY